MYNLPPPQTHTEETKGNCCVKNPYFSWLVGCFFSWFCVFFASFADEKNVKRRQKKKKTAQRPPAPARPCKTNELMLRRRREILAELQSPCSPACGRSPVPVCLPAPPSCPGATVSLCPSPGRVFAFFFSVFFIIFQKKKKNIFFKKFPRPRPPKGHFSRIN